MIQTRCINVDPDAPDPEAIRDAARVLSAGGLVAVPTETVYGLAANAIDPAAVNRIYVAKGRPATNPVIVHVANTNAARELVTDWPDDAQRLADAFWPGPLTLVLARQSNIPDIVTASGDTVAVRVPSHPVTQSLLRECKFPLAAPSANRSESLSPTTAEHVLKSLSGRIDLVLNAGRTAGGIESTVLDLAQGPRILRPGLIQRDQIEQVLGRSCLTGHSSDRDMSTIARSPGQMHRHYAPKTPTELTDAPAIRIDELLRQGKRVGWLALGNGTHSRKVIVISMPDDPIAYASQLYARLHELDDSGVDVIIVSRPPSTPEWDAIRDRLTRASAIGCQ